MQTGTKPIVTCARCGRALTHPDEPVRRRPSEIVAPGELGEAD